MAIIFAVLVIWFAGRLYDNAMAPGDAALKAEGDKRRKEMGWE